MKVKYIGPLNAVPVDQFGLHKKGETKEYPDDFVVDDLLEGKKNKFEANKKDIKAYLQSKVEIQEPSVEATPDDTKD